MNYIFLFYLLGDLFQKLVLLKLPCPNNCGRSYNHRGTLRRHLKYECGVPPQFKCEYCPRTFAQKVNLNKHQMAVHKNILDAMSMCFVELCEK